MSRDISSKKDNRFNMTMSEADRRKLRKLSSWWHRSESAAARKSILDAYGFERSIREKVRQDIKQAALAVPGSEDAK
jgi:hypothetical protein